MMVPEPRSTRVPLARSSTPIRTLARLMAGYRLGWTPWRAWALAAAAAAPSAEVTAAAAPACAFCAMAPAQTAKRVALCTRCWSISNSRRCAASFTANASADAVASDSPSSIAVRTVSVAVSACKPGGKSAHIDAERRGILRRAISVVGSCISGGSCSSCSSGGNRSCSSGGSRERTDDDGRPGILACSRCTSASSGVSRCTWISHSQKVPDCE
mmetsp:Transcript_82634/g.247701  ORF Transcript_82634/g.247701 Transcript_82634/m.247701 type:complete len:214 (-) Transcript_82634:1102-1743(-)